ncbi:MAG: hypothetical protein L3J49_09900 [Desulfobulbaceae bacterium]|nr:hypothetical protein [Desulfobulbaceae bacterium]
MPPIVTCITPEQHKSFVEFFVAPTVTTLIGTVVGVIFGGYITYRFGILLSERKEFRIIARSLRRAFQDELLRLEKEEHIDTYEILAPALNKHEAAVFEFSQILPADKYAAFDKAWKEYYYDKKYHRIPLLEQYADNGSLDKRKEYRKLAIERIRKIISFAKKQ